MPTKLLSNALPADEQMCTLFTKILELCQSDDLHLYEQKPSWPTVREFAVACRPIVSDRDARFAAVHFSWRDVPDDEPIGRRPRTVEEKRADCRRQLESALQKIEAMTPEARYALYEAKAREAAIENKVSGLRKLVGGTAKQKLYAEYIRASKINSLFPLWADDIRATVNRTLDYIELVNADSRGCREMLAKYKAR